MNTSTHRDSATLDDDRKWAVILVTAAVLVLAATFLTRVAVVMAVPVIIAAGWRLRRTTGWSRMMLWAAIGLATAMVGLLTVAIYALSTATLA